MATDVIMGNADDESRIERPSEETDPDEFLAKNAFRMVYQTNNFFLPQIKDLIDQGLVLNLRPEYQRRLRWTRPQKSRLIESLLLNIPVPPIFLYESDQARYEVMDGQQRLNAVREFFSNEFKLASLPVLRPLNGLRYSTLTPRIKRTLSRASLSTIVLLLESKTSHTSSKTLTLTDIRRFIFDRLNTGGTKLNPQEIRNALNPGVFNNILVEITRMPIFTKVFEIPPYVESDPNDYYENPERQKNRLYSSMGDCQLVLRYFALRNDKNIRGSMKLMLDRAMAVEISEDYGVELKKNYEERFTFLYRLFDRHPFRLAPDDRGNQRISAALYDASMVAINDLWQEHTKILEDKRGVQTRMDDAIRKEETVPILTGQQNTANSVRERIELMHKILLP